MVASGDLRPAANRGPILTVANWSGQWPGLVGMLNLNGSLTKAGVRHSTLWSVDFEDALFASGPRRLRRAQRPCAPARSRGADRRCRRQRRGNRGRARPWAAYNALATESFWPRPASAPIARTAKLKARVVLSSSDRGRR